MTTRILRYIGLSFVFAGCLILLSAPAILGSVERDEGQKIAIWFSTEGCAWCDYMEPHVDKLKRAGVKIGKTKDPQQARMYGVDVFPTTIIFANGREVKRLIGYRDYDALKEALR